MSPPPFPILFRDEHYIVIDKPAGLYVHRPVDPTLAVRSDEIALVQLRNWLNRWVYPVHRLDRPTTGVLVYALSPEAASRIQPQFQTPFEHPVSPEAPKAQKHYWAIVRGHVPERGDIHFELKRDSNGTLAPAHTHYQRVAQVDFPEPVGKLPSARYSWVEALPTTGRFHQIRRHFCRISHPLIGDTQRGDGIHNRFWRNKFNLHGLLLRAHRLQITHPFTGEQLDLHAQPEYDSRWTRLQTIFDWSVSKSEPHPSAVLFSHSVDA